MTNTNLNFHVEPAIGYLVDDEDYMGGVFPYTCPNFADILQNCDLQLDIRCVGRPRPQSAAVICPRTAGEINGYNIYNASQHLIQ